MPNQRNPSKKYVGFWFTPEEVAMIDELARRNATNRTEIVKALVCNQIAPIQKQSKFAATK